ncbi:MAG: hypothetical protein DLM68_07165 [Hyphomicrobiales bacterium]|nr:MAG: hypothetical protein DLM68_07165 [Hyphomicrobiales bacterium]
MARADALTESPPSLVDAATIDIHSGPGVQRFVLAPDKDYVFRIGPESNGFVVTTEIKIIGGRNISIVGGHIKRADNTPTNDAADTGERRTRADSSLNILGQSGVVYVEGLLIDNNGQFGVDGLDLGGGDVGGQLKSGDFILKNIHIRGVHGTSNAQNGKPVQHADGLQTWGPVRSLKIDGMTIYSSCQGINIQPQFSIGLAEVKHLNLRYPIPDVASGGANCFAFWLGDGRHNMFGFPARYEFEDVYVQARKAWNAPWQNTSIAPDSGMPHGVKLVPGYKDRAYWTTLVRDDQIVSGYISEGIPPGGDFCPPERIADDAGKVVYVPQFDHAGANPQGFTGKTRKNHQGAEGQPERGRGRQRNWRRGEINGLDDCEGHRHQACR